MVVPVDEQNKLVRVKKVLGGVFHTTHLSSVVYAPLVQIPPIIRTFLSRAGLHARDRHGYPLPIRGGILSSIVCLLCVALRSHVRPLTHTPSSRTHITHNT